MSIIAKKRKRTPYAIHEDKLLVESAASGIHLLVRLVDGLTQLHFPGDRKSKMYMYVDDVIRWHEKELADTRGACGNQKVVDALKQANAKFAAGDLEENPCSP